MARLILRLNRLSRSKRQSGIILTLYRMSFEKANELMIDRSHAGVDFERKGVPVLDPLLQSRARERTGVGEVSRFDRITRTRSHGCSGVADNQDRSSGRQCSPIDGVEKVTGKALYAGDLRLPGMKQRRGATLGAPRNFRTENH